MDVSVNQNEQFEEQVDDTVDQSEQFAEEEKISLEAFASMDKDGDGSVTMQELSIFDRSLNKQDLEAMIDQADEDGNGTIELPEYLAQLAREESPEEGAGALKMDDTNKVLGRDVPHMWQRDGRRGRPHGNGNLGEPSRVG